jgi:hypothetical protein
MAAQDSTTGNERKGQEGPLCEKCGEFKALPGKKICFHCNHAQEQIEDETARKQAMIEDHIHRGELWGELSMTLVPLKSFCSLLNDEEHEDFFNVLDPMVERLEADLMKIEAVIASTLGHVAILVCKDPMKVGDKQYLRGDFFQAVLEVKESRDPINPLQ